MKNIYPYWGVRPDFLTLGMFNKNKRDEARKWCVDNCKDKFISSDLYPWAFLDKNDAIIFQKQFGGWLKFKDAE